MSETKHTPGPWTILYEFNVMGWDGRRLVANAGGHQNNKAVEQVDAENTANARLIAAAPELLEALRGMVAWFSCERGKAPVDAAKAAIAKAEGR